MNVGCRSSFKVEIGVKLSVTHSFERNQSMQMYDMPKDSNVKWKLLAMIWILAIISEISETGF